jgi:hypothetical protein
MESGGFELRNEVYGVFLKFIVSHRILSVVHNKI